MKRKRVRGGKPDIVFKNLVVHPMRPRKIRDGEGAKTGIKQRMHICRGHFKDYRDGPGLFGKYQDIYWWEHHVRGDSDIGVVHKTYEIATD